MTSTKISILQVGKYIYPEKGGIETITKTMFDYLQNEVIQNDVLCFKRKKGTQKTIYNGSSIIRCGTFFNIASTPISIKFFAWFRKLRNNYDVVHIHHPNPLAAIALFFFPVKGKVVLHWHSDILTHEILYFLFSFFERKMLQRADLILGTSPTYIQHSPHLQAFHAKCKYLHCCTDESKFSINPARVEEIKRSYDNRKIVFSLGRFIYYKGFEYLIEAASFLSDEYVVLIAGGGPLRDMYIDTIDRLKLFNKVFLIQDVSQEEIGNYFEACDVFCLPSCQKTEAFGIVLIEAMLFGKPIVSTAVTGSGITWVNANGITGFNVEPRNSHELAEAIGRIFHENLQDKFGENGRQRYKSKFSREEFLMKYTELIEHMFKVETAVIKQIASNALSF